MKVDFLPEEQKISDEIRKMFNEQIAKLNIKTINDSLTAVFDLQDKLNKKYNVAYDDIPDFKFDPIRRKFFCPVGEYVFFVKKLKSVQKTS